MKPRLEPRELTPEDQIAIGMRVLRARGARVVYTAHTMGLYHDRRDSDLMLQLTQRQQEERIARRDHGFKLKGPAAILLVRAEL